MAKPQNRVGAVAFAAGLLYFGYSTLMAGRAVFRRWEAVGAWYAGIGIFWVLAGPAMLLAAVWMLASLGRWRLPFRIGGVAAVLAGAVLVGGVLTYVIPCSGPS